MTAKHTTLQQDLSAEAIDSTARAFVDARQSAGRLDAYPGDVPADLACAYRIQDCAIDLWPDEVRGWKVGRIPPALEDQFGCDRLAGPIFAPTIVYPAQGEMPDMPVFADGFAAVEAEFVAVIADDAPAGKVEWSRDEAEAMIGELRTGLEVASSPLGAINDLGPAVTASDFGNNAGLIIGPAIPDWSKRAAESLTSATSIDGKLVGEGGAYLLTGGVTRSVQFLLELAARRGRPVRAGDVIATGQTTGIHEIAVGQVAKLHFGRSAADGELACRIVAAA
jgi:2-keto-4-pentenoate hydratase